MEKPPFTLLVEKFIEDWNGVFPDCRLTVADLKKPHAVMEALLQVLDRLGIDRDAILKPPPEEIQNEHLMYYWDLLPMINMTRVLNHLVSITPRMAVTISMTHFLQPTAATSHSILLILVNLLMFIENRLSDVQPYEEQLFSKSDQVKVLEDRKNKLLAALNEQAEEKGKRAERLEKFEQEIKQFEEELRVEKEAYDEEQKELEDILTANKQTEMILEQKKGQRDGLMAEIEKKKALRVYDADDIKSQQEQAAQNVQDAEEKLKVLKDTLTQKENSLKNLQTIKPNLDIANNLLHEIMKLSESLRDYENGDLDSDSKEGELDVLNTELSELELQLAELRAARAEAAAKRQEAHARRQQDRTVAQSNLRDAENRDGKCRERCKAAAARTQELRQLTVGYERAKADALEELARTRDGFTAELKNMNDILVKKAVEEKKKIEAKLKNRSL